MTCSKEDSDHSMFTVKGGPEACAAGATCCVPSAQDLCALVVAVLPLPPVRHFQAERGKADAATYPRWLTQRFHLLAQPFLPLPSSGE